MFASGQVNAHAGSRARVTSMGGLYDAATLRALLESLRSGYQASVFAFSAHVVEWHQKRRPMREGRVRFPGS